MSRLRITPGIHYSECSLQLHGEGQNQNSVADHEGLGGKMDSKTHLCEVVFSATKLEVWSVFEQNPEKVQGLYILGWLCNENHGSAPEQNILFIAHEDTKLQTQFISPPVMLLLLSSAGPVLLQAGFASWCQTGNMKCHSKASVAGYDM